MKSSVRFAPLRTLFLLFCALLWLFGLVLPVRAQDVAGTRLDPNKNLFPRASQHDFSDLVPAPSGGKGFLTARGDHFYWADGSRARFWGINVANTSLQESDANIEAMLRNFRAAGFNLVRLHHFDERGGIIDLDKTDSRQFNAARWRKLDFWIAKARENGLYVYLDLLDYRNFKDADGVDNAAAIGRSAKPYAVFDPRLIELQQEYARQLLRDHINPYTGLSYANDPAVAFLEIYDENGLFMRRGLWRSMPEPYAARFKAMWNQWLQKTYGTTANLRQAWVGPSGNSALSADESLEAGTVELPAMTWEVNRLAAADKPYSDLARRSDGARFAVEVHRRYFHYMKSFLREAVGVKIPLCATGRYDDLSDLSSQAAELDFIGCNFYYDHPYWGTGLPQWQLPSYYHARNPLTDLGEMSMAATLGLGRMRGKPFVVREWNYCYPNPHRGEGMLEAATFGCLQDIDAMILFTYETNPKPQVGYFNVRSDPARWQMAAVGARMFLGNLVRPARNHIVVPYGPIDLYTYEKYHNPLYTLAWTARIENDPFEGDMYLAPPGTDLIVPPGRSSVAAYSNAPALLYRRVDRADLAGNPSPPNSVLGLTPLANPVNEFAYDGWLYAPFVTSDRARIGTFPLDAVRAQGEQPIGINEGLNAAHGYLDMTGNRLVFSSLERDEVARAALDALRAFRGVKSQSGGEDTGVSRSDTGEVVRDAQNGRLMVRGSQVQILAGNLGGVKGFEGGFSLQNAREGAFVALALDGLPLVKSRRYVLKMTADARNLNERAGRDPRFARSPLGQWRLEAFGSSGVITNSVPTNVPLRVLLNGKLQLQIWQQGGAWELYIDGVNRHFWCEAPIARWQVFGSDGKIVASHLPKIPVVKPSPGAEATPNPKSVTPKVPSAVSNLKNALPLAVKSPAAVVKSKATGENKTVKSPLGFGAPVKKPVVPRSHLAPGAKVPGKKSSEAVLPLAAQRAQP